ncbi:hypothetical protein BN1708_005607 [Verticillium longisporum]|uniref:Heterokaryon incompatibility domain-containing protein n=1 Tax=Verticillium longisporum TaxID=100787 RepID=A0A0G4MCD9_VERLO|nr:hypothetical protein BN1708_005607 [Verticillium longisporum]
MSSFPYERLDLSTHAIRLLNLRKGGHFDPIRCNLVQAILDDENLIPYKALSYTWGDASDRIEIKVDDRTFGITRNLYDALDHLRSKTTDILLWVDAVCIDQDHHKERNHQAGQMKRIYENADDVIIWLGLGSHETDILFEMIQWLDKESTEISRRAPIDTWIARWSDLLYEGSRNPAWQLGMLRDALREVLARKWFERVWVIQEAYSAKTATVVCGYSAVRSRAFALMPAAMGIYPGLHQQALLAAMPGPLRWQNKEPESRNLKTLLQLFGGCKASDERDNIYALPGIASDASQDGVLQPRYDLPMEATLRSTISYLRTVFKRNSNI